MQRKIGANSRTGLWIERIVWNAAAAAVLAVMILVLLGSLRWLDQVAPPAPTPTPTGYGANRPAVSAGTPTPATSTGGLEGNDVGFPRLLPDFQPQMRTASRPSG